MHELGPSAVSLLSARQLRSVQAQLELLRGRARDALLVAHADAALEQLRALYVLLVGGA